MKIFQPVSSVFILLILFLALGCGYGYRYYRLTSESNYAFIDKLDFFLHWAHGDASTNSYSVDSWTMSRSDPEDSLLFFIIAYRVEDTNLLNPINFRVENVYIDIEFNNSPKLFYKYRDSILPFRSHYPDMFHRRIYYGPLIVDDPLPEKIKAEFDIVITDPDDSSNVQRQHMVVNATRKTKSLLMEFLDGA